MKYKKFPVVFMAALLLIEICFPVKAKSITIKEEEKLGKEFMKVVSSQFRFIRIRSRYI